MVLARCGLLDVCLDKLMLVFHHPALPTEIPEALLQLVGMTVNSATFNGAAQLSPIHRNSGLVELNKLSIFLAHLNSPHLRTNQALSKSLCSVLLYLTYGDRSAIATLFGFFEPYLHPEKLDMLEFGTDVDTHESEEVSDFARTLKNDGVNASDMRFFLECFCHVLESMDRSPHEQVARLVLLQMGLSYRLAASLVRRFPPDQSQRSEKWQQSLSLPSVPFLLRILAGLVHRHPPSQQSLMDAGCLPVLHVMENIASADWPIGSTAETVLQAVMVHANDLELSDPTVVTTIEQMRQARREEKKKAAMAKRMEIMKKMGLSLESTQTGKICLANTQVCKI